MSENINWHNNYFKVVGAPRNLHITQLVSGSVIAPWCIKNNLPNYLLIEITRKDGQKHWEFPRGFAKPDEDPSVTAKRECQEETGLTAYNLKKLGTVMPDSGLIDSEISLFKGEFNDDAKITLQKSEKISDYRLMTLGEIKDLIRQNKIIDGYTLAAVSHLMTANYVQRISSNTTVIDNIEE